MKTISLLLALAGGTAAGVDGQEFRTDINPALLYYQSFMFSRDLSRADDDFLRGTTWRGKQLPERYGELMAGYDTQFSLVRRAAHATVPCDWGIDFSPGPNTMLPQLARCKRVAVIERLRADWDLQNGREAEARDDLLGTLALGRNSSRDGTLIAALVQIAIEAIACSTVAENYYRLPPETLKQLADGFDAAPARGTIAAAMATEKADHDWMVNKIVAVQKEHPGDDTKVMAALEQIFDPLVADEGQTNVWTTMVKAAGGTSNGVLKMFRDEGPFYDRLAAIMALPQPEYSVRMKELAAEVQESSSAFIGFATMSLPKAREKEFRSLAKLAMVRAAAEYKLHGEAGLKTVRDPFGNGPFSYERFVFQGVDRGFALKSAYSPKDFPSVQIFVEKDGPPFVCDGLHAGQPVPP